MNNIIENNKLIAKFMGLELPLKITEYSSLICSMNGNYHKDCNWLMKVVEKIESLNYVFEIKLTWCGIKQIENGNVIVLRWEEDKTKIEAVYNACVEFIKWYNNHLCSNCGRFDDVVGTHNIDTCEECALNN